MYNAEESIKELNEQIVKLDNLILMGETFIHMVNSSFGKCTLDELPSDIQGDYISIMKDISESRALKRDLELMLQAAKSIFNNAAAYGLTHDEHKTDTEVDVDE